MDISRTIKEGIKKLVNLTGYDLQPLQPKGLAYISVADTQKAAKEKNQTILQYLETIWGLETAAKKIIAQVETSKHLTTSPLSIVEIGAGTGAYTAQVFNALGKENIARYQIYETSKDWSAHLAQTYPVETPEASGYQLESTTELSADLIHAHGVFVYTSFITTSSYFNEIFRIAKINGIVAFDVFDESCFTKDTINAMINAKQTYFNIVPEAYIMETFAQNGFELVHHFPAEWGTGQSRYFVFSRKSLPGKPKQGS